MIQDTVTRLQHPAITSDQWHVVHARWSGAAGPEPLFERTIVSEHVDRAAALDAARALSKALTSQMLGREAQALDQVIVRRPAYKTRKTNTRVEPKPR